MDLVGGTSPGVLALVLGAGLPGETAAVLSGAGATGGPAPFVVADLDGDLHEEVVRATARGLEILHLAPPPGPAPYALRLSLRGGTDERRGVGAVLEVRAGDLYRRIAWRGEPVVIGLGDRMRVDVLQVTWPDGSMQHEIGWFADGECVLEQRDRRAMGSH